MEATQVSLSSSTPLSFAEALRSLPLASSVVAASLAGAGGYVGGLAASSAAMYLNYSQPQPAPYMSPCFPTWPGGYPWQYPLPLNQIPATALPGGQGGGIPQPQIQAPTVDRSEERREGQE